MFKYLKYIMYVGICGYVHTKVGIAYETDYSN